MTDEKPKVKEDGLDDAIKAEQVEASAENVVDNKKAVTKKVKNKKVENKKPIQQETIKNEPLKSEQQNQSMAQPKTSILSVFHSLISFILITAVVGLGFYGYQQLLIVTERISVIEGAQQENSTKVQDQLASSFSKVQNQLQQKLQQMSEVSGAKSQELSEQLESTQRQVKLFAGRHRTDWLLAEADYLVRIANNRLVHERDPLTALALLMSAEERIILMDDPSLTAIREALSRDMASLRLSKKDDVAGIAIRISGLIPQIEKLAFITFELPQETIESIDGPISEPATDLTWQDKLKLTLKELSVKWFEVRDHGRAVKPMMTSETESIITNNMTLFLQSAQFATLKQHEELYHQSLGQMSNWIIEYYEHNDPMVLAFKNEIDSLNALSVRGKIPSSLESRLAVAREVESRLNKTLVPASQTGEQ